MSVFSIVETILQLFWINGRRGSVEPTLRQHKRKASTTESEDKEDHYYIVRDLFKISAWEVIGQKRAALPTIQRI